MLSQRNLALQLLLYGEFRIAVSAPDGARHEGVREEQC